jgi:hypothetical protein
VDEDWTLGAPVSYSLAGLLLLTLALMILIILRER